MSRPARDKRIESVRDFAERVGRSHSTISQAIKEGRIPSDAIKRHTKTGKVVGIYWRQAMGEYRNNTDPTQAARTDAARWRRRQTLAPGSPPTPVQTSAPAPAPIAPELVEVARLFALAAKSEAAFAANEASLRAALRAVPKAMRQHVPLHARVMDQLTAAVYAVAAEEGPGEHRAVLAYSEDHEMTDAEADEIGTFWYEVAAGEWVVAQPVMSDD
jgi:DNA-binding transcriptional MocR family regulator